MKLLILILLSTSIAGAQTKPTMNDNLHKWAQKVVFETFPDDLGRSYDICVNNQEILEFHLGFADWADAQNACAIITSGAE